MTQLSGTQISKRTGQRLFHIHLACNDNHGRNSKFVERIDLSGGESTDLILELEGDRLECLIVKTKGDNVEFLRLGNLIVRIAGHTPWAGNMIWDMVALTPDRAAKVLNYLRREGWCCIAGWMSASKIYDTGEEWTGAALERLLIEND
jgi:hypothetical protein